MLGTLDERAIPLQIAVTDAEALAARQAKVAHTTDWIARVIDPTERRVFADDRCATGTSSI